MQYKPGDKIMIKVGGKEIETVIDQYDEQRLPCNPHYVRLIDGNIVDLNKLSMSYNYGQILFEDYLDFMLNIGYSVGMFAELSDFENLDIDNPAWKNEN